MLREELRTSDAADVVDVVTNALVQFAARFEAELDSGIDSVIYVMTDDAAFAAMIPTLMVLEEDIAKEIARRTKRSSEDFDVRSAANASFGVFRAAVRASVQRGSKTRTRSMIVDGVRAVSSAYPTRKR